MFIATYSVILLSVIVLIIAVYFFVSQRALYVRGPLRDAAGPALLASAVLIVPYLAFSLAGFLSKREQSSGSAAGSFFSVFAICPAIFIAALICFLRARSRWHDHQSVRKAVLFGVPVITGVALGLMLFVAAVTTGASLMTAGKLFFEVGSPLAVSGYIASHVWLRLAYKR